LLPHQLRNVVGTPPLLSRPAYQQRLLLVEAGLPAKAKICFYLVTPGTGIFRTNLPFIPAPGSFKLRLMSMLPPPPSLLRNRFGNSASCHEGETKETRRRCYWVTTLFFVDKIECLFGFIGVHTYKMRPEYCCLGQFGTGTKYHNRLGWFGGHMAVDAILF
jgi:hypothetical protein